MTAFWPDSGGWNLAYASDVFGPLFDGGSVKQAGINTLELWQPTYIAEVNRQRGRTVLYVPSTYLYRDDERPIAARTSQTSVSVPRTYGEPERRRDGTHAWFVMEVRTFFAGLQDWNESEDIAHAYGATAKGAIGQHPSLGDFAEQTIWKGFAIGSQKRSSTNSRVVRLDTFHVLVANVLDPFGGPSSPSVNAPADQPTVANENITLEQSS